MRREKAHVAVLGGRIFCNISFLSFQFHSAIEASYPVALTLQQFLVAV